MKKSIAQYQLEYDELISQAEIIKSDFNSVESKVAHSVALLDSFSNEQTCWDSISESFKVQMSTIVRDVLLSSALMAYGGYYDQAMRNSKIKLIFLLSIIRASLFLKIITIKPLL